MKCILDTVVNTAPGDFTRDTYNHIRNIVSSNPPYSTYLVVPYYYTLVGLFVSLCNE